MSAAMLLAIHAMFYTDQSGGPKCVRMIFLERNFSHILGRAYAVRIMQLCCRALGIRTLHEQISSVVTRVWHSKESALASRDLQMCCEWGPSALRGESSAMMEVKPRSREACWHRKPQEIPARQISKLNSKCVAFNPCLNVLQFDTN